MAAYPIKLENPVITGRVIEAIGMGCKRGLACKYAGISRVQFNYWMDEARERMNSAEPYPADDSYISFYNRVRKAEADRMLPLIAYMQEAAAAGDWRAADKLASRYEPEEYGDKESGIEKKLDDNSSEIAEVREMVARCLKPEPSI